MNDFIADNLYRFFFLLFFFSSMLPTIRLVKTCTFAPSPFSLVLLLRDYPRMLLKVPLILPEGNVKIAALKDLKGKYLAWQMLRFGFTFS